VLDEPAAVQSDPALLTLQLRALGKEGTSVAQQALGAIPHNDPDRCVCTCAFCSMQRGRQLERLWLSQPCCFTHARAHRQLRLSSFICRIGELHKSRPAAVVSYSRPMPDIEALMQVCVCVCVGGGGAQRVC
jgi:intraflagellar transport protein 46